MPRTFPSQEPSTAPLLKPISSPTTDPSQSPNNKPSKSPSAIPSVDPSKHLSSAPSYLPSLNTPRAPSEQHVGYIQEERRTTLEQVKALDYIIVSGEIRVDKYDQLQKLYIIKLKYNI